MDDRRWADDYSCSEAFVVCVRVNNLRMPFLAGFWPVIPVRHLLRGQWRPIDEHKINGANVSFEFGDINRARNRRDGMTVYKGLPTES